MRLWYRQVEHEFLVSFFESADLIFSQYESVFRQRGLSRLNSINIALVNLMCNKYLEAQISSEQAYTFIGEWLTNILRGSQEYMLALKEAYKKYYHVSDLARFIDEVPHDHIVKTDYFLQTLIYGNYFEAAETYLSLTKNDKTAFSSTVANYVDSKQVLRETTPVTNRPTPKSSKHFSSSITNNQFEVLYWGLIDRKFISTDSSIENFKEVFSDVITPISQPVIWLKKSNSLAYLLHTLHIKRQLIYGNWQTNIGNQKRGFRVNGSIVTTSNFSSMVNGIKKKDQESNPSREQQQIFDLLIEVSRV